MTTQLIVVSDPHINSTVALGMPGFNLDDGGTYRPNRTGYWLWRSWLEFWQEVDKLDGRKIVCFLGDLAELDTMRRTTQIVGGNKADIQKLVQYTIEPAVERADQLIFIRGTPAHEGKGCWIEETVGNDYDNTIFDKSEVRQKFDENGNENKGKASWYHMRCVMDSVRLDIAHHCRLSGVPWGRSNSANNLAHKIFWQYTHDMEQPAPHLALRAHNHKTAESNGFRTQVSCSGSWTTPTEYCYRIGFENDIADIGGDIFTLENGNYTKRRISFIPKESRRLWALKI